MTAKNTLVSNTTKDAITIKAKVLTATTYLGPSVDFRSAPNILRQFPPCEYTDDKRDKGGLLADVPLLGVKCLTFAFSALGTARCLGVPVTLLSDSF